MRTLELFELVFFEILSINHLFARMTVSYLPE
jgi:hypothetical protein